MPKLKHQHLGLLAGWMLCGAIAHTVASGLQVSPTGLSLPAGQRSGVFTLTNTGGQPLTAQVRVYRWTQDEQGKDVLTPSKDMVASPPMVKLAAGGAQQFRVIRTQANRGNSQAEESFRLIVDELPAAEEQAKGGLQFVLRYSIPVFLNQTDWPEATLQWQAKAAGKGQTLLSAQNIGSSYAQLSAFTVGSGNQQHPLIPGLAGYVLPGKTAQYLLDTPLSSFHTGIFSVTVNGRQLKPEVKVAAP